MLVEIKTIKVRNRSREDFGDIEALAASIVKNGLLQPIVLDKDNVLVAGGRRIAAHMHLGKTHIEAVFIDACDPMTRKELELEENLQRKDFTWVEEVNALKDLYDLKVEKYGGDFPGDKGFTMKDASEQFDRSIGSISMDIQLARALEKYPELVEEKTKQAAFKRFKRQEETALRAEQARRTRDSLDHHAEVVEKKAQESQSERGKEAIEGPEGTVRQMIKKAVWKGKGMLYFADSRDVCRLLPDNTVDCIVTDPPFALGMFKEGQNTSDTRLALNSGHMYDDDPDKIMDMLDQVFMHCARLLKPDGHAYVFFHMTKYEPIFLMLRKHFGTCEETPLVWAKNTPGIGDPNRTWVYSYEPCFFINRGRSLVKPQAFNVLRYDTIPPGKKIHPTQKPDALLRHIISASCVPGEVVLDPFAGSGSTLVAASQVGCRFIGVEREEEFHRATTERIAEELAAGESHNENSETQAAS